MKRCPQCEFIYEDDQSHCDMDGARLRHDSRPIPGLEALGVPGKPLSKPKWRSRMVTMPASVILVGMFALVYYVSTHQPSSRMSNVTTPPAIDAPADNAVAGAPATASDTPVTEGVSGEHASSQTDSSKIPETAIDPPSDRERSDIQRHDANAEEKPVARTEERNSKPQSKNSERGTATEKPGEKEKEESKVRSMFNKTKRFLKKNLPL